MVGVASNSSAVDSAPPLPQFAKLEAPAHWECIDFLSDLHLQEATPHTFDAFEAHLRNTPADAVFILGDLFEAWVGDDARFEGFELRCAGALASAAKTRHLAFMVGNRDFLVGTDMLDSCGMAALQDPTVLVAFGQRLLLTHGDALCLDDHDYQQFRAQVRQAEWQRSVLARPLQERRALARQMREASEQRRRLGRDVESYGDLDAAATTAWMRAADTPVLIHGHTHRPARHPLAPGLERWVLSDWDFDHPHLRGDVLRLSQHGLERVAINAPPR